MSHSQARPSNASSMQCTQADWMTETQLKQVEQEHSLSNSTIPPAGNTTTTTSNVSSRSLQPSQQGPPPGQNSTAVQPLAHSLPSETSSRSQSFMAHALKGIPERNRSTEEESQESPAPPPPPPPPPVLAQPGETTFGDMDVRPQSTAPQPAQRTFIPLGLSPGAASQPRDHEADDGGSRSMELTNVHSGKEPPSSQPSREHKSVINSSQANTQSQSDADQSTQPANSPSLPPMAESTRNSRPQFGPNKTISSPARPRPSQLEGKGASLLAEMTDADTQYVSEQVHMSTHGMNMSSSSSDADDTQYAQGSYKKHTASQPRSLQQQHSQDAQKQSLNQHDRFTDDSSVIPDSDPGLPHPSDRVLVQQSQESHGNHQEHPHGGAFRTSTPRPGAARDPDPPSQPAMPHAASTSSPLTDHSNSSLHGATAPVCADASKPAQPSALTSADATVPESKEASEPQQIKKARVHGKKGRKEKGKQKARAETSDEEGERPEKTVVPPTRQQSHEIGEISAGSPNDSGDTSSSRRPGIMKRKAAKEIEVSVTSSKKARVVSPRKAAAPKASSSKPLPAKRRAAPRAPEPTTSAMLVDDPVPQDNSDDEDITPTQPTSQDDRDLCGQLRLPRMPDLVIHRVFAYHAAARAYFPAEIISLAKDRARCLFDDGEEVWSFFKDLRSCQLKDGDPILYAGVDDSQGNEVEPILHTVYRVEWADQSGRVVPDGVDLGPSMIVAARESSDRQTKNRFQVRAIKVPATKSNSILQDRKLPPNILAALKSAGVAADPEGVLFGARSTSKDRSASVSASRRSASISWSAASPDQKRSTSGRGRSARPASTSNILQGYGFLLTGYVKDDDSSASSSSQPDNPIKARALTAESTITDLIEDNGGQVFDEISEIFQVDFAGKADVPNICFSPAASSIDHLCLLANAPSRKSLKYLLALGLGLPCIATGWLDESLAQSTVLPIGPALLGSGNSFRCGASVFGNQSQLAIESDFSLEGLKKRQPLFQIFKDKRFIHVTANSRSSSVHSASQVLAVLGATSIARASDKDRDLLSKVATVDYVLLEDNVKLRQPSGSAPFVNLKWIKECLISGRVWEPNMYQWD